MRSGAKREPPAGSKVEHAGRLTNDCKHRRKTRTAETFFKRPQSVFRPTSPDQDQLAGTEAETSEPATERKPGFSERHILFDPKDWLALKACEPSQQRCSKTGQRPAVAGLIAADLMQRPNRQTAAELVVKRLNPEGNPLRPLSPDKLLSALFTVDANCESLRSTFDKSGRPAFDGSDFAPKRADLRLFHELAEG